VSTVWKGKGEESRVREYNREVNCAKDNVYFYGIIIIKSLVLLMYGNKKGILQTKTTVWKHSFYYYIILLTTRKIRDTG
jgi:hypothetical protein